MQVKGTAVPFIRNGTSGSLHDLGQQALQQIQWGCQTSGKGGKGIGTDTEGVADLQALRLESDSMEHGSVDHHIVGVVQHICIEGPTGDGLVHHAPGASRQQSCVYLQWTGACTAKVSWSHS